MKLLHSPIFETFFKAMARSLGLEDDCFLNMCGENAMMDTRFNVYPPCPRPDKIIGFKAHADASAFTLLLPDKNVQSLQFLKDGKWYKPTLTRGAIMIIVGDITEIMSNGIYKSMIHKVVANKAKARLSVATFSIAGRDKEIKPVDELVSEARPKMYKATKNYVDIFYQQSRRPIEIALI